MNSENTSKQHAKLATIFEGLAHPRRIKLLEIMKPRKGAMTYGELMSLSGFSRQVLTHHLRKMEMGKIIRRQTRGKFTFYWLTLEATHPITATLAPNRQHNSGVEHPSIHE